MKDATAGPNHMNVQPRISAVIRNRNEAEHLQYVLAALRGQSLPIEIIVVDNQSTDDSRQIAFRYAATVTPITKAEFTYGRALNEGIHATTGEIVVILSAHSIPLGARFLEQILGRFDRPDVAAVRCCDVRYIDKLFEWTKAQALTWPVSWDQICQYSFVNSCCAIRRSVWEKIPFEEQLEFSEDWLWARNVLQAGFTITSSDAYYWYMRRPSFRECVRGAFIASSGQYRISGYCSLGMSFRELLEALLIETPKIAARSALVLVSNYIAVKLAPYAAARHPYKGSLR